MTEQNRKSALKHSISEGKWWAIMWGFGDSFLPAFAVLLKATNAQLGLLVSIPQLFAAFIQLLAIRFENNNVSRKNMMLTTTLLQGFTWFAIFLLPWATGSMVVLIILATFYAGIGAMGVPFWVSWMGDLVDQDGRGTYFGRRNRIVGFITFMSLIVAGTLLDYISQWTAMAGFAMLFTIAGLARLYSARFFKLQYEPETQLKPEIEYSFLAFIRGMGKNSFGMFTIYVSAMNFAVYISGPLMVAYWLQVLGFGYFQLTILMGTISVSSFLLISHWGKHIDQYGNRNILEVTSYIIALFPLLWYLLHFLHGSVVFYVAISIQILGGLAWSGYNLSLGNYVYDAIDPHNRLRMTSYHNVFKGIGLVTGGLLAGVFSSIPVADSGIFNFLFPNGILVCFLFSTIARMMIIKIFMPRIREIRLEGKHRPPIFYFVAVMPFRGLKSDLLVGLNRTIQKKSLPTQ
ncbi:MAG: MFS transporter [Candidatus Marinimicrobia bacterium]|nr:MFS transporter [Candidatus Neomarinimicrobiota bacterium]